MAGESIRWTFYGYVTPAGGRAVQEWYDGLTDDEREEAQDTLVYLQSLPRHLWGKPEFEVLDQDLSEVRFRVNPLNKWYRIYGAFWPEKKRYSYSLLLGKDKKVKNDKKGKREAVGRLKYLRNGKATVHEFELN